LATGVSRQPVLDCGTIFHPDCGGRDFPSILSDDPWKHISLATEAPIVTLSTYGRYINKCIYLSIYGEEYDDWNSDVFRSCRNCSSDGAEWTDSGRAFHARSAATGKVWSPSVVNRVDGMTGVDVEASERS